MNRDARSRVIFVALLALGVAACGGSAPPEQKPASSGGGQASGGTVPVPPPTGRCQQMAEVSLSGIPSTMTPGQHARFRARVVNTGDTWWYHGAYFELAQRSMLTITPPSAGYSPSLRPGGVKEVTFDLQAPMTAGTYTLTMQNVVRKGADAQLANGEVCAPAGTSDVFFGEQGSATFTVR